MYKEGSVRTVSDTINLRLVSIHSMFLPHKAIINYR